MSKCFPYKKISSQSIIKGQAVFHAHISLGYLNCSKIQNCEYGKERNTQIKLSAAAFSGKALSCQWFLLCQGCGICCICVCSSLELKCERWQFFFPFFIFSVYHKEAHWLQPLCPLGYWKYGVNFNFTFSKCDVFTGWKGLDQALLWGKKQPKV